jgi:tetratricopeptide (TPR) repeat protein
MRFPRQPILVLALLGSAVAVPALAQQSSQYPAPCDAAKVSRSDVDRAHTLYLSGKQFLDESNYDKAISYFKDAYSIDCSVHGILPIIATAYERKGDKLEAIHALEEYLKRAPTANDREVIERRVRNLKEQVAATTPATTTAPTASAPPTAAPPTASATATTPPTPASTETGPAASSSAAAGPSPTSAHGHSVAPWVVFGVGAVAAVTGVVLYAVGTSKVSNAASACPSRAMCAPNVADQGNTGRTLEAVGGIAGGVGLAAMAGGLIWHFAEPTPVSTTGFVAPTIAPGYAGVSYGGTF